MAESVVIRQSRSLLCENRFVNEAPASMALRMANSMKPPWVSQSAVVIWYGGFSGQVSAQPHDPAQTPPGSNAASADDGADANSDSPHGFAGARAFNSAIAALKMSSGDCHPQDVPSFVPALNITPPSPRLSTNLAPGNTLAMDTEPNVMVLNMNSTSGATACLMP